MMKKDIIMFDLGGILYSIKHSFTHQALRALQRKDAEPIVFSLEQADPIFGLYDSGHIFIQRLFYPSIYNWIVFLW